MSRATQILREVAASGSDDAAQQLLPIVYAELHDIAERFMRGERQAHTLQATALVHEAYVKLIDGDARAEFTNRAHFLGIAARAMRQVLIDHARKKAADKRGNGWMRITLEYAADSDGVNAVDLLALDEALEALRQKNESLVHVVELRYFGGLTIRETTHVLGVSHKKVEDDWSLAKAWLARELNRGADS